MIFDLSITETGEHTRMKPRNRVRCEGEVLVHGEVIGALSSLAVCASTEMHIVGGHFILAWHRLYAEFGADEITLRAIYTEQDKTRTWTFPNVQVIYEGAPLVIASLDELLGLEVPFFVATMETA